MKKLILSTLSILFFAGILNAQIIETSNIQEIRKEINDDTLVLFNLAEVLTDTETSLGTQAWRKFIRRRVEAKLHDELTLFAFKNIPHKSPEASIPELIDELQSQGIVVLAFTSRGRPEWYTSQFPDIDLLTEKVLLEIGFDFSKTKLNKELALLPSLFEDFYHSGIIYGTNIREKDELLLEILQKSDFRPSKIVFVDDKIDSLISMEAALNNLNIPFVGYAYSKTKQNHASFNPLIANIQLDWLITYGQVLTDKEAIKIMNEKFFNIDLNQYFNEVIGKWDISKYNLRELPSPYRYP
ncbi:MAG: DUF2608 domain-containing protein [Parachlamydiaceae bacterium]|nr:DUF2608 domain-containing protein [Parachlamydiaceae bacterium]